MRFRFSIRDLLWLTLVIALALGWFVHQRQLQAQVSRLERAGETTRESYEARIDRWRHRAAALEYALRDDGWELRWEPRDLHLSKPGMHNIVSADWMQPIIQDD